MNVEEVLGKMMLRFISDNEIPVERAMISRREWEILERFIKNLPYED